MGLKLKISAAVLALLLICSCSREGFEESLNRKDDPGSSGKTAASQLDDADPEEFIFDLSISEYEEDNRLYSHYTIAAASEAAEKPAQKITDTLGEVISNFADEIADGREYEQFALYDAVTRNDGEIFSVMYEVELVPVDGDDEEYIAGFVFNAQTGERLPLDELIKPETLVTLILDEQSSKISGRKEEVVAQKRKCLADFGESEIKKRLLGSEDIDIPFDASFYVDGNDLVAVFSAIEELGEPIEVSVGL